MAQKPTYKEMAKRVQELEAELSERDRLESGLQVANEELISIFDSIDEPVYVSDPDTYTILYANSALKGRFGENIRGRKCHGVFQNLDVPCDFCTNPLIFGENTGKTHIWEFQNKVDNRWYRCIDRAIKWPDGRMVRYEMAIDVHEHKLMEEALQRSEKKYRILVEAMNEAFSMVDENKVRIYANERLCEMLGCEMHEIVGVPADKNFDETNSKLFGEQFARRKKGGDEAYEITFKRKDGQKVPTIVSPRPVFDENGKFKGSIAVITDITKLKQTEEALKEREKELETQAANLEEVNAALKVLLKRRDDDKRELEEKVLLNVRELVDPYLEKLKNGGLNDKQKAYLDIMESNLNDIISPFSRKLYLRYYDLSPSEMQIAALVRHGKTTKEIANLLNLSTRTVDTHRLRIRTKLGIRNKKSNLRSYLLSLQ
jgi:PAS domain S-box-containing protein